MTEGRRPARVAEAIREYVSTALIRDLSDPRLSTVSVSRVDVPPDLTQARVFIRIYAGKDDARARKDAVRAATRAAGHLRRGLGSVLGMKFVPELRFEYDAGPDASRRIEELLSEIKRETSSDKPGGEKP